MAANLKALSDIISSSVEKITKVCAETGKAFPSIDEPIQLSEFTPDGIRNHPKVMDAIALAVAAAFQLIQTIQAPPVTLTTSVFRHTLPMALGIAEKANVAEIIRSAGPKGMHVDEIASKSNIDPNKLARILRFLATNHWFREVSPDTFATNLLSSLLDTRKEITGNFAETKHEETPGLAAIAGYGSDEPLKAMGQLKDLLFDPKTAFSEEVDETGFQRALGTTLDSWAYYDSPEGQYRGRRFAAAMSAASKLQPPQAILTGFDWGSLPTNSLVVDVGGGVGHVGLEIAKAFPGLNIALEDRPVTIENAKGYWKANLPSHIEAGKIHFVGCDFFEPQPTLPGTPDVFLLRMILHDWSDKYAIKLLRNLRNSAGKDTKLVIVDSIINYACETKSSKEVPGPPSPLLPNLGGANLLAYEVDLVILSVLNSAERTSAGFTKIIEAAGWKLEEIRDNPGSKIWWPSLICVPA